MTLPLPYVTMAVFCQEARQHPDGTLTLTNVLDRITVSEVGGRLPRVAPLVAVVGLRCDSAPGTHQIRLDVHQPSGASHRLATLPVEPRAEGDNIARILRINLDIHELGDYWVDVGWDDRVVTRMRLSVVRAAISG
jgi:hypothetical protein